MKTRLIKSLLNIAPLLLIAVALMQLYRANMELRYDYESLEFRMKSKTEQIDLVDAELWRRTLAHGPDNSKVAR